MRGLMFLESCCATVLSRRSEGKESSMSPFTQKKKKKKTRKVFVGKLQEKSRIYLLLKCLFLLTSSHLDIFVSRKCTRRHF